MVFGITINQMFSFPFIIYLAFNLHISSITGIGVSLTIDPTNWIILCSTNLTPIPIPKTWTPSLKTKYNNYNNIGYL